MGITRYVFFSSFFILKWYFSMVTRDTNCREAEAHQPAMDSLVPTGKDSLRVTWWTASILWPSAAIQNNNNKKIRRAIEWLCRRPTLIKFPPVHLGRSACCQENAIAGRHEQWMLKETSENDRVHASSRGFEVASQLVVGLIRKKFHGQISIQIWQLLNAIAFIG